MTRVTRLLVIVASSNCWNPSFSSIVATGSRPPYGVRFLPSKSYGVEAPILLGSGCVAWIACLAALFRLCFFPRLTIWVTSLGFCAAELLPPHPRFYSMFSGVTNWSTSAQPSRIRSRVHNSGRSGRRQRHDGRPLFSRRGQDSKIANQMETRCRHQGRELFDQFTIAHDHVRGAIPPR